MKYISFVVDKLPLHYYQAQLLLHSIVSNTAYTKEQIIVQCIEGVSDLFIAYLERCGFRYVFILPYLDGAYCNKLAQLDYFQDKTVESLTLIDTDVYLLDNAIYELRAEAVAGKVVDAANPPMETITNIFKEASLPLPAQVRADWQAPANVTVEGNFNGGFYHIPGSYVGTMRRYWRKWASWLFERAHLFQNRDHAIHTDQLSFAMALQESAVPHLSLESNYNFPLHTAHIPSGLNRHTPIHMLHYHRLLNDFGFIDADHLTLDLAKNAVAFANGQIAAIDSTHFFYRYKRSHFVKKSFHGVSDRFKAACKQLSKYSHMTIYLHTGTPKTATTTLQYLCADNKERLKSRKLLYPGNHTPEGVPKHQWLVSALLQDSEEMLIQKLQEAFYEASQSGCSLMLLSTEGVYNHWWDFSEHAKSMLHTLAKHLRIEPIVVLREPFSFLYSFYRQNLKNPKTDLVRCYGQSWSFQKMLQDRWFIKHLDYLGFICEMETLAGKPIHILPYSQNILNHLFEILGVSVDLPQQQNEHKNIGLSQVAVELLILLNRFVWEPADKRRIVEQLTECDYLLKKHDPGINDIDKKLITELFQLQRRVLLERYDIVLQ